MGIFLLLSGLIIGATKSPIVGLLVVFVWVFFVLQLNSEEDDNG